MKDNTGIVDTQYLIYYYFASIDLYMHRECQIVNCVTHLIRWATNFSRIGTERLC